MSSKKNKKRGGAGKAVRTIILLIALAVFCYSAYQLYSIFHVYRAAGREYDELAENYTDPDGVNGVAAGSGAADGPVIAAEEEFVEDAEPPFSVDFESLRAINPDVIGWLYVDALPNINYPICRGEDNDYYLHHTFRKEYLFAGSIFMDCVNTPDFSDPSTIVYGHNMRNQSMFGLLKFLKDQEKLDSDPYFWILTPTASYRYHIYSAFDTRFDSDAYTLFAGGGDNFLKWEEEMKSRSVITQDVPLSTNDHTVILSTCTSNSSVRCVVFGKCVSSVRPPAPHVDPALFDEEAIQERSQS